MIIGNCSIGNSGVNASTFDNGYNFYPSIYLLLVELLSYQAVGECFGYCLKCSILFLSYSLFLKYHMGDYVNITGNNKDEIVDDNRPTPLFVKVVLNDLIFQQLQQYLNDTNIGTNNLLNVSRRYFRRLKKEYYYWELKPGCSIVYLCCQRRFFLAVSIFSTALFRCQCYGCKCECNLYYILSSYRKLKLLITSPEKQLSLNFSEGYFPFDHLRLSLKGLGDVIMRDVVYNGIEFLQQDPYIGP
jgi:hypothetical protein